MQAFAFLAWSVALRCVSVQVHNMVGIDEFPTKYAFGRGSLATIKSILYLGTAESRLNKYLILISRTQSNIVLLKTCDVLGFLEAPSV